jgi:hypothetical protein
MWSKSGYQKQERQKPAPTPLATPINPDRTAVPTTTKLAMVTLSLKNDPMYQDFDAEGFEGLISYRVWNKFVLHSEQNIQYKT